ncbi:MAG: hypothetical protein FWD86_00145 [Firmicutes bacterium]|nr:hypothetical protein [Bacillota bacterium]
MKKRSIISTLSLICLALVLIISAPLLLTGCGVQVPDGFILSTDPAPIDWGQGRHGWFLFNQFPDLNPERDLFYVTKKSFVYNGEKYHIETSHPGRMWTDCSFIVTRGYGEVIGTIIHDRDQTRRPTLIFDSFFVSENYLYYSLRLVHYAWGGLVISREGLPLPVREHLTYYKYKHFRFDIRNGQSESVPLDLFFEKLFC